MKFQSTFAVLVSLVIASYASTVADIETDIASIASQTTTLDNAINAFPATGGSLVNALAIHTDAVNLGTAIDKGTTDNVTPTPFSESDGSTILSSVQAFEPTILDALTQIVVKKPAFTALPIGGIPALIKQDLINLNASTFAFEAALIANAPADLVPTATSIKTTVDAAFASAIAAYS
ncbi:hydrophobic surface binding protein [Flammula alnicola]|nr:hydrophobic surface binding protein [Flammula alnicola]